MNFASVSLHSSSKIFLRFKWMDPNIIESFSICFKGKSLKFFSLFTHKLKWMLDFIISFDNIWTFKCGSFFFSDCVDTLFFKFIYLSIYLWLFTISEGDNHLRVFLGSPGIDKYRPFFSFNIGLSDLVDPLILCYLSKFHYVLV